MLFRLKVNPLNIGLQMMEFTFAINLFSCIIFVSILSLTNLVNFKIIRILRHRMVFLLNLLYLIDYHGR